MSQLKLNASGGFSLLLERSRQNNVQYPFVFSKKKSKRIPLSHSLLPSKTEEAFLYTTQNLREPQMALQVKPQIEYLLIISKIPTNRQKNNTSIGHSKFMYTYILRKELSVELGGRGSMGKKEEKDWGN